MNKERAQELYEQAEELKRQIVREAGSEENPQLYKNLSEAYRNISIGSGCLESCVVYLGG